MLLHITKLHNWTGILLYQTSYLPFKIISNNGHLYGMGRCLFSIGTTSKPQLVPPQKIQYLWIAFSSLLIIFQKPERWCFFKKSMCRKSLTNSCIVISGVSGLPDYLFPFSFIELKPVAYLNVIICIFRHPH